MKPHRINSQAVPVALCLLSSLGLWLLPLLGGFSAQLASLYELQAALKREAMVSLFEGK
ncbi:hypothetical protein J2Z31_005658 [Sinorhizobium kostiense]|uniref:Transmembrane protein n=1 Tax=Sinorhizobium kostiense TaxID=76747 RepID=A0ABS4RBA9_9HYPH|nr:hypothetical protein [Sinorhizobium kostiense]